MCPDEWQDSFGDEFYDYALDNSFFFLSPKTDWKAGCRSVDAPGIQQIKIKTDEDLEISIEILKHKAGNISNE